VPIVEPIKVVASLREAAVLDTIAVVTLNESITITVLEAATLAAPGELRSTPTRAGTAAAVMPRHCTVMTTAAAVAHSGPTSAADHCFVTTAAAPSATVAAAMAATVTTAVTTVAHQRHWGAEGTLQVGWCTCRLS
jgi:hypothetical protein